MDESGGYIYSLREAAIALVKANSIHEGYWAIAIEFQMGATIAGHQGGPALPTGMVSVSRIGLKQSEAAFPLAVDAAAVNPAVKRAPRKLRSTKSEP